MIYDVSMQIEPEMQVYKNKPEKKPVFECEDNLDIGSSYETTLCMNLHTGTHIDYPLHMMKGGKTSNSENLSMLLTRCRVIDLSSVDGEIKKQDLVNKDIKKNDFVLFKTKNSYSETFDPEFVYVGKEAAGYLAEIEIKGVGIDGLGIERSQPLHPTHLQLLSKGIVIIEGLRLAEVDEKIYEMICLPLKIKGVEATPARIILKDL